MEHRSFNPSGSGASCLLLATEPRQPGADSPCLRDKNQLVGLEIAWESYLEPVTGNVATEELRGESERVRLVYEGPPVDALQCRRPPATIGGQSDKRTAGGEHGPESVEEPDEIRKVLEHVTRVNDVS